MSMWIRSAVRNALDAAAKDEDRPRAHVAEKILCGWLREKGYLKERA
jgi:hypothetical protein